MACWSRPPHLKLAILGDYIWMHHYHTSLDVQTMPELVFKHNQNDHGLYTVFYQYFARRWESPDIPEYDLETDEIVFRRSTGSEVRRDLFDRDAKSQDCLETVQGLWIGSEKTASRITRLGERSDAMARRRVEALQAEGWEERIEQMSAIIDEHLAALSYPSSPRLPELPHQTR